MEIEVKLENCYGIAKLEKTFFFDRSHKIYSIYASNGTMKTSFAKTMFDFSQNQETKDEIYPDNATIRDISEDGNPIEPEKIFVIKTFEPEYESKSIALLLVNKDLKKKYDKEYSNIKLKKDEFLELLKNSSGHKRIDEVESEICYVFCTNQQKNIWKAFQSIAKSMLLYEKLESNIKYNDIFNEKTQTILNDKDFLYNIGDYVDKYNQIIDKSLFFKKGVFNHTQASDVTMQLDKNGFFKADHKVLLNKLDSPIKSKEEFEHTIEEEKRKILEDPQLKNSFEKFDQKISKNIDLKSFRDCLASNPELIAGLGNINNLKTQIWQSYIKKHEETFNELLRLYEESQKTIEEIRIKAKEEKNDWNEVVGLFKKKFFVPFSIEIANQSESILEGKIPQLEFKYKEVSIKKDQLKDILSQGERRALYILNILFDVYSRNKLNKQTVLIIDDIADSFDYRNKYAIVSYIKEISELANFYVILLTHNFDFHRTVCKRVSLNRDHTLIATKNIDSIDIQEELYQNNPFIHWVNHLDENRKFLIACIPFVRNLFEYSCQTEGYKELTKYLHIKKETLQLTFHHVKEQFKKILDPSTINHLDNLESNYFNTLIDECLKIEDDRLESKVVLAMGIRLVAEYCIIQELGGIEAVGEISKNQTFVLIKRHNENLENSKLDLLSRVSIMTPENIHVNSFMFEPILDMGIGELNDLFKDVYRWKESVDIEASQA